MKNGSRWWSILAMLAILVMGGCDSTHPIEDEKGSVFPVTLKGLAAADTATVWARLGDRGDKGGYTAVVVVPANGTGDDTADVGRFPVGSTVWVSARIWRRDRCYWSAQPKIVDGSGAGVVLDKPDDCS